MKADQGDSEFGIMAEINMIPLIDVALVLLIIFMVLTPILVRSQIQVNLPGAKSVTSSPEQRTLHVQVSKDGQIYVAGQAVLPDALESSLRGQIPTPADQTVVIEADKQVAFEHVVKVMDTVKKIGVTKMGVAVKQEAR
ncbi:MAG: biopolymer transporter ExbD [bacterium]